MFTSTYERSEHGNRPPSNVENTVPYYRLTGGKVHWPFRRVRVEPSNNPNGSKANPVEEPAPNRLVQVGLTYPSSTHVIASYINGFTSYLTLFSKYFSTFVHTTCSLSILEEYLALRDVYLALWTARSSNPTLWPLDNRWTHPWEEGYLTGLSPSLVWPSSQLINLRWLHWPSVQNTTIRPCYPGSLSIPIVGLVPLFVRHY